MIYCIIFTNFSILQIIDFPKNIMDKQNPFQDELSITIKPRDYKCPCGKTYLSYAALFTHIKQKHEGKAPGKITKPPSLHQKRGRPPIKPREEKRQSENIADTHTQAANLQPIFPPQTEEEREKREQLAENIIIEIVAILDQMPEQQLNKAHLNEIEVFSEMNVYLNTRYGPILYANGNICIADGYFQFASTVCQKITWSKFQPFYLLFMLFLQFIIDTENNKKLLTESSLDLFCEYINDFIQNHLKDMAGQYELQSLWIIQKQNSIRIFYKFFNWCMFKRYVTYRINMAHQQQTKNQAEMQVKDNSEIKVQ